MATIKSEYYRFNGFTWDLHYFKTSMDMVDGLTSALSGKLSTTGKAADADKLDGIDSVGYLKNNDALMPRNAFGGRKLFTSHLDNAFFLLNERYTITAGLYNKTDNSLYSSTTITQLFNSDYDGGVVIPLGKYLKLHVSFAGSGYVYNGAECWPDYPYGKLYLSYYHIYWPESARFRVYSNYADHGLGWSDYVNFGDFVNNGSTNRIQVATQSKYAISEMEIIVESPDTGNPARLTQIDFSLDRPTTQEMPVVSKFINQKIYKDLDFVGTGKPKVAGQQVYHPGNKPAWTDIASKPSWIGSSKPTYTASEVGAAPLSHTHGSITNDGKIGSASDRVLITGTAGAITTRTRSGIDSRDSFPAAAHTLTTHSDVTISSPANGQVLKYDGSKWVNSSDSNTNYYLTAVSGSANGTASFARSGLSPLSWDTTHTHPWTEISSKPTWIGADKPTYSWNEISSKPTWIGASKPTYTAAEVGAAATSHTHSEYVPTTRKIAGKQLSGDIWLYTQDIGDDDRQQYLNATLTDLENNKLSTSAISAWAKASSKPTYTWSEITSKPTNVIRQVSFSSGTLVVEVV